jgi:predicted DNA-binding protein
MSPPEATETVAVRLPKSIITQVDWLARSAGRTRSNLLARLISRSVDSRGPYSYTVEKFYLAVLSLIGGTGGIRERLESAAIAVHVLSAGRDFPESLRERYASLWDALTREEAEIEGEGTIHATIRQMDPDDAAKLAEQIFDLYFALLEITPFGHQRE